MENVFPVFPQYTYTASNQNRSKAEPANENF